MAGPRPATERAELEGLARRGRLLVIETVAHAGAGHIGGPLSAMDLLIALYFRVLRIRPEEPGWPARDRFILSKRIGIEDMWGESAPNAWLLDRHGLTPERVAERVRRMLSAED